MRALGFHTIFGYQECHRLLVIGDDGADCESNTLVVELVYRCQEFCGT